MNTALIKKFFGGAASGALVTAGIFVSEKCGFDDLKQFGTALGLVVVSGLFHYLKNWLPSFRQELKKNSPENL